MINRSVLESRLSMIADGLDHLDELYEIISAHRTDLRRFVRSVRDHLDRLEG